MPEDPRPSSGEEKKQSGPPYSIKGQLFAISGAGSGIGRATATLLVASGAKVALGDKNEEAVSQLARELGASAIWAKVDVTVREEVEHWLAHAPTRFGLKQIDGMPTSCLQGLNVPGEVDICMSALTDMSIMQAQ